MTSPLLRRAGTAAASLTLALALVACGSSDGSDGDDRSSSSDAAPTDGVPTDDELAAALLTSDDVPEGFEQSDVDDDDDDEDSVFADTCLGDVADFDDQVGTEPVSKAKTQFTVEDETTQSLLQAGISLYDDEDAVVDAFDEFYSGFSTCTDLSFTDDGGNSYALDVTADDTVTIDGADSQLTIKLTGTATAGTDSIPIDFGFLVVREGAAVSHLSTSEVGDTYDLDADVDALAQTQADRLADVLG